MTYPTHHMPHGDPWRECKVVYEGVVMRGKQRPAATPHESSGHAPRHGGTIMGRRAAPCVVIGIVTSATQGIEI